MGADTLPIVNTPFLTAPSEMQSTQYGPAQQNLQEKKVTTSFNITEMEKL